MKTIRELYEEWLSTGRPIKVKDGKQNGVLAREGDEDEQEHSA